MYVFSPRRQGQHPKVETPTVIADECGARGRSRRERRTLTVSVTSFEGAALFPFIFG